MLTQRSWEEFGWIGQHSHEVQEGEVGQVGGKFAIVSGQQGDLVRPMLRHLVKGVSGVADHPQVAGDGGRQRHGLEPAALVADLQAGRAKPLMNVETISQLL